MFVVNVPTVFLPEEVREMQNNKLLADFQIGEMLLTPIEGFETLQIVEYFCSHNRVVARVCAKGGGDYVLKVMGEKHELKDCDIMALRNQVRRYKLALISHDVNVPPPAVLDQFEIDDRPYLLELTPYCGQSLEMVIKAPDAQPDDVLSLARAGLDQLRTVFRKSRGSYLPVGIDMVPRNFAVAGDKIVYVDLMPPKFWQTPFGTLSLPKPIEQLWQHATLEFPSVIDMTAGIIGFKRHFTKEGVLIVWLTQLARLRPEMYLQFQDMIEDWLDCIGEHETLERFQARRLCRMARIGDIRELAATVMQSGAADVYLLREAACLLAHRDGFGGTDTIFDLTHFQHERPDDQKLNQAKDLILHAIAVPPYHRAPQPNVP